jgi:hypothetical protein
MQMLCHIPKLAALQINKYDCLVKKILIGITGKSSSIFDDHWDLARFSRETERLRNKAFQPGHRLSSAEVKT